MKHTPGPWKLDSPASPSDSSIVDSKGEFVVAGEYDGYMTPFSGENARGNAYLVAAAPELLEALECVLPEIEEELHRREISGLREYIEPMQHAVTTVRAAIAKAKGE